MIARLMPRSPGGCATTRSSGHPVAPLDVRYVSPICQRPLHDCVPPALSGIGIRDIGHAFSLTHQRRPTSGGCVPFEVCPERAVSGRNNEEMRSRGVKQSENHIG